MKLENRDVFDFSGFRCFSIFLHFEAFLDPGTLKIESGVKFYVFWWSESSGGARKGMEIGFPPSERAISIPWSGI